MIKEEIQQLFSNSIANAAYQIDKVGKEYPAFVVRFSRNYGVAVFYEGEDFCEDFANVHMYTSQLRVDGIDHKSLFLMSDIEETRNEFSRFCEDFVDPGIGGVKRKELICSPLVWWEKWSRLIGNSMAKKQPHAILAELMICEHLLKVGIDVEWGGPGGSSHDLMSKDCDYEVKSTTSRYDKIIHVAGQYQMQKEKALKIVFCRLEKSNHGISINDMVDRIVKLGKLRMELESKLSLQGFALGKSARNEKYILHDALEYVVDKNFPCIVPESFIGGVLPKGISHLEYDVNLELLDGKNLK